MSRSRLLGIPGLLLCLLFHATATAAIDPDLLAGLSARSIGPSGMSGRIADVVAVPTDPNVVYVGAATGGVWKSIDGGLSWEPIFEDQSVASIGAIAIDARSPDVLWLGTGEGNVRNSTSVGNGIYRSRDAGRSWEHLGLEESERIHRVLLHPSNPDVVFVAVLGKLWSDAEQRGVYRTVDGGATWERVLYVNERTGCADLAMDPSNPDKLIAAMYEHRREPWFFESGGPGSGLYMSLDGGSTWTRQQPEDGLPEGDLGRIGVRFAPSNPQIVYALVEAKENGVYRSSDGGFTWKNTGAKERFGNRPFYYADLRVDPQDPDRVYSLWSLVSVSNDGGKSWEILIPWSKLHPDHHAMWIHPTDGNFIINGNDGGVGISRDRGKTWRFVQNLPVAQYYHIAVDMENPYNVYGGMQDNGSWRGPNTVWKNGGIRNHDWQEVAFGDGFDTRPHPQDSQIGYAMSQEGYLRRWDLRTGEQRMIRPAPPEGEKLRFNWNAALAQDPFEPDTIYYGSQYVHKSTDRGDSWVRISGDLTTNNPEWQKQDESGGLTPDVTGAENFCSIVSLASSPRQPGVLWAGTDDGRLHVTQDGGATWTSLEKKIRGVPEHTWIPHICASPYDAATAFVVFDDHRRGNLSPYVYVTRDFGRSWKSLSSDVISGYALVIEQDPIDPELLFLGTEFGLYVSTDGGKDWMRWTHGVPTVSVMDLVVHPREHDLVLGTHGRAAFVLDDIRPLRSIDEDVLARPLHLFEVAPAQQYWEGQTGAERFPGATEFRGETRTYGAIVNFVVNGDDLPHPNDELERARKQSEREAKAAEEASSAKQGEEPEADAEEAGEWEKKKAATEVEVEILDANGERVRIFRRDVHRGLNRIHWDLRSDPFRQPPSEDDDDWMGMRAGPEVPAGDYTLVLRFGDQEESRPVTVLADPRMDIAPDAREAAWEATQRAGAVSEKMAEALTRIVDARSDCDLVMKRIQRFRRDEEIRRGRKFEEEEQQPHEDLKKAARKMRGRLDELEGELRIPSGRKGIPGGITPWGELSLARWYLGSSWDRPTPTAMEHLERAETMIAEALVAVNSFFAEEMPPFRQQVEESDVVQILTIPEPVELPAP